MSHRRQIKTDGREQSVADVKFMNKYAQIAALVSPRNLYAELGRGSSKTSDILTERMIEIVYDMPGAPCAWVSDTFTNLTQNVIPTVLESLERKGYHEGVHYVVAKRPPLFNEAEKKDLPDWLKPTFWKHRNRIINYERVIIFFTGTNFTFGSLDRPSTLAGRSFVHIIGDEAKYFKETKLANMMKAVRGYPEFSGSVYYRGHTFTSDVADPSHIGEYDWMAKYAKGNDIESLLLVIRTGLVFQETQRVYLAAKDRWMATRSAADLTDCRQKLRLVNEWHDRWVKTRRQKGAESFYLRASSFVNVDILTIDWFRDAIRGSVPDLDTAILSKRATLESGSRFYAALDESHFYYDGINEDAAARFGINAKEDASVLRYLDINRPLRLGIDFGNMCSLVIGQEGLAHGRKVLRCLKFIYTLAPDYVEQLGEKFRTYFEPMKNRILYVYYDRAGNQYEKVGKSQISAFKNAVEVDHATGRRTGWTVHLMSMKQSTITQAEEYSFMLKLLSGDNPRLPGILIDYYQCKELRLSLQRARTKVRDKVVYKDKNSERLPVADLPEHSTNPSDAFKYFCMSRDLVAITKGLSAAIPGNTDPLIR